MELEKDFVDTTAVEFEIEGRKFKFKPTTAGQENDWLDETMSLNQDGTVKQNFKRLNQLKMNNLVEVPYGKDIIHKMIGVDKDWSELDIEKRWTLLGKLSPKMFDAILNKVNNIDREDSKKKDSSKK